MIYNALQAGLQYNQAVGLPLGIVLDIISAMAVVNGQANYFPQHQSGIPDID